MAFLESSAKAVYIRSLASGEIKRQLSQDVKLTNYVVSADGKRLAARVRLANGVDEIWLWDIQLGKVVVRLSHPWKRPRDWVQSPLTSWDDANRQPIHQFDFSPGGAVNRPEFVGGSNS